MTEREKSLLRAVLRTLEGLTVTGTENMSKVLGCVNALEELIEGAEADGG